MLRKTLHSRVFAVLALGLSLSLFPVPGQASGGGGSGGGGGGGGGGGSSVDTIKVIKCEYAVVSGGAYVELLISAASSNSNAMLVAYMPDGSPLGIVQNGAGGRYGGTVFGSFYVPATITILSNYGGSITVPCTPYQP